MQSAESPSSYCRCYQNGTDRCLRKCQSRNDVDVMIGVRNWIRTCDPHVRSVML
jgi:hypothetical protein